MMKTFLMIFMVSCGIIQAGTSDDERSSAGGGSYEYESCHCEMPEDQQVNEIDEYGRTRLHWAVEANDTSGISDLLSISGIKVNIADNRGYTPLHIAVLCNLEHTVNNLLAAGADMDFIPGDGISPYGVAIVKRNWAILALFNKKREELGKTRRYY